MAGSFTLPTVLANLTAGNQALSLVDGDFNALYNPLVALGTFGNYYVDSGAANAYAITVSAPQTVALAAGLPIQFLASNANTGASTLQINALAAKNIKNPNGTSLSAGQIPASGIVSVMYDGAQFQLQSIASSASNTIGTEQASTSGTSILFTGIPSGVKKITVNLVGVSTNGSSVPLIRIGPSGGVETSGYTGGGGGVTGGVVRRKRDYLDSRIRSANRICGLCHSWIYCSFVGKFHE